MPDEMYSSAKVGFSLFLDGLAFSRASALLAHERKRHSQADHQLMAAIWSLRGRQHHGETCQMTKAETPFLKEGMYAEERRKKKEEAEARGRGPD